MPVHWSRHTTCRDDGPVRSGLLPARWRKAILALGCTAVVGATGCQSTSLFSRGRATQRDPSDALTKALADSQSAARTTPASTPPAGPTTTAQHLQLGDQALAEHASNPARLADARHHFEEVLRAQPAHGTAHHRLGVIADLQRDFPAAERHYAQALQQNPGDPQLLHDIGYSYLLQEQPAKAIPYLQQSLAIAPTFEMAARKLADAQVRTRQYDLAAQTLQQVLPAGEVQSELNRLKAAHDPAMKPSLLGRVRDNMRDLRPESQPAQDPTQQLLAELELARQGGEQARQQRAAQSAAQGYGAANPWAANPRQQQQLVYDSQLSGAMAQIDRQAVTPAGQTLYLDASTGGAPQYGQPPYTAVAGAPMAGGQVPVQGSWPAIQPTQSASGAVPAGYQSPTPQVSSAAPTGQDFQYAEVIRGVQRGTAAPWEAQHFAANRSAAPSAMAQPTGVVPAQASYDGSPGAAPQGVSSALYSAQTPSWTPPTFGRPAASGGATPQGNGAAVQSYEMTPGGPNAVSTNWGAANPADEYRAAAALGMGAGPGQMFPVIQQTAVSSPGTGSLWNGAQFPQPARQLPIDRPVADLSQAHRLPSQQATNAPLTPPPNSLGQQMPSTGQYWTQPGQFASGQSYQQPAYQQPTDAQMPTGWGSGVTFQSQPAVPAAANPLDSYNQLRAQHDAQLNASIQQVQGQYPSGAMVTPSYGLPVERPAPAAALMNSWYGQTAAGAPAGGSAGVVTPEQYPSSADASPPSFAPQVQPHAGSGANVSAALPPPQYAPNVVVPSAYPGARGQWTQPGIPSAGPGYSGPLIVPGH